MPINLNFDENFDPELVAPYQSEAENETEQDESLYEHYRVVADPNQKALRVDKFLSNRLEQSRTRLQYAAEAGSLWANGEPVKSNYKVRPGDIITIMLPKAVQHYTIEPEEIPINIVYEDETLLVLDKQAGLVVHPGIGNFNGTMLHALAWHYQQTGQFNELSNEEHRFGMVHRIDKETSGLLVLAKTRTALTHLAQQFYHHTVNRRYTALAWGDLKADSGTINLPVGRHKPLRKLRTVYAPDEPFGKHAITHYSVLKRFGYVTLVECKLETGRTHQIRVHFQHMGHPLFNDLLYGGNRVAKGTAFTKYRQFVANCFDTIERQALHARLLGFEHPTTHQWMEFESQLPNDFQTVINMWDAYAQR